MRLFSFGKLFCDFRYTCATVCIRACQFFVVIGIGGCAVSAKCEAHEAQIFNML